MPRLFPTLRWLSGLFLAAALHAPAFSAQATPACWKAAAEYHGVDMWLLYSIAWVESRFNPLAIGRNKNGSMDLGLMQINTIWLPELRKHGITPEMLLDGCTSVYIGAWVLAKNFRSYGYTWRAIGAYNSSNLKIGYQYAQKVYAAHRQITGLPTPFAPSVRAPVERNPVNSSN